MAEIRVRGLELKSVFRLHTTEGLRTAGLVFGSSSSFLAFQSMQLVHCYGGEGIESGRLGVLGRLCTTRMGHIVRAEDSGACIGFTLIITVSPAPRLLFCTHRCRITAAREWRVRLLTDGGKFES